MMERVHGETLRQPPEIDLPLERLGPPQRVNQHDRHSFAYVTASEQ